MINDEEIGNGFREFLYCVLYNYDRFFFADNHSSFNIIHDFKPKPANSPRSDFTSFTITQKQNKSPPSSSSPSSSLSSPSSSSSSPPSSSPQMKKNGKRNEKKRIFLYSKFEESFPSEWRKFIADVISSQIFKKFIEQKEFFSQINSNNNDNNNNQLHHNSSDEADFASAFTSLFDSDFKIWMRSHPSLPSLSSFSHYFHHHYYHHYNRHHHHTH